MVEEEAYPMKTICKYIVLLAGFCLVAPHAYGAQEAIYGLESVVIEGVCDPNSWPQRFLLVSGSLKLVGGDKRGNVWQTVTHIPQRPVAPRSDFGTFRVFGNTIRFHSLQTYEKFIGTVKPGEEKIVIERFNRKRGQLQTEVWYLVR